MTETILSDPFFPFQFPFMQHAFLICMIISLPAALLSCFLVLKGWSLMGDSVSHAVLPGIVLAYILKIPLIIGAFGAGMVCSLLTGYLAANSRVKQDTVMGVVFSGMFGIGIVMFTATPSDQHLEHILFGNMLGIRPQDLITSAVIAGVVVLILGLKWKDFLLHAFDSAQARVSGLNTALLHYGLLTMLSLTIVASLTAVGIILTVSLLIAPGAIAFLTVRRFSTMLIVALAVTLFATFLGTYLSFWIDSAPGATIVLTLTIMFLIAFARRLHLTRKTSRETAAEIA